MKDTIIFQTPTSNLGHWLHLAAGTLFLSLCSVPAMAQEAVGIVAIVNDEIITDLDLDLRLQLALSSAGLADTLEARARLGDQILPSLVDEALQIQEAVRLGVGVTDFEVAEAKRILENRNGVPAGGLARFLAERGVDEAAVLAQVEAEIAWTKVINASIAGRVEVADEEIDEVLARFAASEGKFRVLLAELLIEITPQNGAAEVVAELEQLRADILAGAEFSAVARQFSRGASAYQGGDVGWVLLDQLEPDMMAAVAAMEVGTLSSPIPTSEGYYLVLLRDRRVVGAVDPRDIQVHLMQVALPLEANAQPPEVARTLARAESIGATVVGCAQMAAVIDEVGTPQSGDLGRLRLGDMPGRFSDAVVALSVGQPSAPVRSEEAVHVFMVCAREDPEPDLPTRDDVANSLWDQRLDLLARRYLRDLRRAAVIEYR
jgi:peptidyl-prolyl cis-trans isomerase SurA